MQFLTEVSLAFFSPTILFRAPGTLHSHYGTFSCSTSSSTTSSYRGGSAAVAPSSLIAVGIVSYSLMCTTAGKTLVSEYTHITSSYCYNILYV